ncbi:MAG: UDP-2,4-diacetamido-2,4,6-trideoxy-beta-L-altropyranose hydrolase [Deltaproteobacteria bacterium]|nr:UDP-2,4-diacetamido-2,4,6-trideoxy-beta-L-altropyranose hydrolase [Deltaproteobacteria bacterium]
MAHLQTIIFRADAGPDIGTGHVMRCLALAQAWLERGGRAVFAMSRRFLELESRLTAQGVDFIYLAGESGSQAEALETACLAQRSGAAWIVIDGYNFGAEYQKQIKDQGGRVLFIDDYGHAAYYYADLVLNQNLHARGELYQNRTPDTRLLLGCDYILLRHEFQTWRGWPRDIPAQARNLLITMGGSDPENLTQQVISTLGELGLIDWDCIAVAGPTNPHYAQLVSAVQASSLSVRLERNVTDMSTLMAWADVAVSAGGTVCWEMAFMGLPNLVMITADNQVEVAQWLHQQGVAVNLGWSRDISSLFLGDQLTRLSSDAGRRTQMSRQGRRIVDGLGPARVIAELNKVNHHLDLTDEE